jgi:hypothetical protein
MCVDIKINYLAMELWYNEAMKEKITEKFLSEQEKAFVEKIEQLPIDDKNKIDLILVWRKIKPATEVDLTLKSWYRDRKTIDLSPKEQKSLFENIKNLLGNLNLFFIEGNLFHNEIFGVEKEEKDLLLGDTEKKRFYVASTKENAQKLYEAWNEKDEEKSCVELGRLFGFPESAIEAYKRYIKTYWKEGGIILDRNKLPEEIKNQDSMAFAEFQLSQDNWQNELVVSKKWAEEIKKVDPALYDRTIEKYKKAKFEYLK